MADGSWLMVMDDGLSMNHSHQPLAIGHQPSAILYNPPVLRPYRGTSPRVHPTAFVDASAQVIGDVEIGEETSVWMCVVIRGDVNSIKVGKRTNIQDGSVVHAMTGTHPTTIGDNVTVGHAAVIHGCTIEDQCLIGMGAIVLNGAHVGAGSIVAAGTLLVEGQKVPPRSLVMGSPGKVKRLLTHAEAADIQRYADHYVGYRLDYMNV
jgi:carbonic anhydrase/acetyltransferase-like protein (isoleucine patch superfamily)